MVGAALCFTVMVGLVKLARAELGAWQVIFWRSVAAAPLIWGITRSRGYRVTRVGLLGLRIGLGFGAMGCFYTAAKGLPLADLNLISLLQPVLVAAAAPLLLGRRERAEPGTWGALLAGLAGCAVLLAPGLRLGSTWGLWALGAAVCSAGAQLCLRALGATEEARTLVFWFHLITLIVSGLLLLATGALRLPSPGLLLPLAGVALAATAGQLLMTRAYALDRAALVAGASYSSPLFGVAGDLLFFSVLPGPNVWIGGLIVVAAGLWLLRPRPGLP